MHIQLSEALALLARWKSEETRIRVQASGAPISQELLGTIRAITGSAVEMSDGLKKLEIDLTAAHFNGDPSHSRYLICEFSDGRCYRFHVAQGA